MITMKAARMAALLTVRELVEKAGVSPSTVSLTETGQSTPRISVIRKLVAALNVQPAEIAEFRAALGLSAPTRTRKES